MSAGVKEYDAALGRVLDRRPHTVEIQTFALGREVRVCFDGELDVAEDLVVVGPCWRREVDGLVGWTGVEAGKEEGAQVDGTGAGNGLERYCLEDREFRGRRESLGLGKDFFTRFSFIAGLSAPRRSFCAAEVNSARPAMGRYS